MNKRNVVRLMAALSLVPLLGGMIAGLACCGLLLLLGLYVSD